MSCRAAKSAAGFSACDRRTVPVALGLACGLVALPLIVGPTTAHAQTSGTSGPWDDQSLASQITDAVDQFIAANHIPGAAISIGQGSAQWVLTTGTADLATNTPVQPDTIFGYRSVTKSFVATAVLQLAGEGLLSLNDPVGKYVSGVPDGNAITLQDLLDMRSGLYNYTASSAFQRSVITDPSRTWTPQQLLDYAFAEPLQFKPGSSYEYSNTNTLLLGQVITSVTGQSWSQQIAQSITGPLGLTSIQYPGASPVPAPNGVGYVYDGGTYEPLNILNSTGFEAAGGLTGTITNLANWG